MAAPERHLVVAAVIRDRDGRYLLTRRRPGAHLEGMWEFPGGTVEIGEDPEQALRRELEEELGVGVAIAEPLTFAWHMDTTREVVLLFFEAVLARGTPSGREGQLVRWVTRGELADLQMPPADSQLVHQLVVGRR